MINLLNQTQILYTIGGIDNLKLARKYYSYAIELSDKNNLRAIYGLLITSQSLKQFNKGDSINDDLIKLANDLLLKNYTNAKSDLVGIVEETIKELGIK